MTQDGKLRVGILFGGQSAEHEISILSARNVLVALDRSRFEPVLLGIDKAGRWLLQDAPKLLACADDPRRVKIEAGQRVDIIVEAAIFGREIELAVLGGTPPAVSLAGEIIVEHPDSSIWRFDTAMSWLRLGAHGRCDRPAVTTRTVGTAERWN